MVLTSNNNINGALAGKSRLQFNGPRELWDILKVMMKNVLMYKKYNLRKRLKQFVRDLNTALSRMSALGAV
jgi:hypothetical protein